MSEALLIARRLVCVLTFNADGPPNEGQPRALVKQSELWHLCHAVIAQHEAKEQAKTKKKDKLDDAPT